MFGYVIPYKPEMKMSEYELYRAVYCGLCRAMGRCTGTASRLTLSYDFVFLAMVRCALEGGTVQLDSGRCPVHPVRRRAYIKSGDYIDFAAKAAAVLTLGKTEDDVADEKGTKRLLAKLVRPGARRASRRADLPGLEEKVKAHLEALSRLEADGCASPDTVADGFGALLADVCAYGLEGSAAAVAHEIGRLTGRCIYMLDAADDAAEDRKRGRYNPLVASGADVSDKTVADGIMTAFRLDVKKLADAAALLDFTSCPAYENIIGNIVSLGLPRAMERALTGKEKNK